MILTEQNYFSLDSEREYMSNHLWKMFMDCESKAMAYLRGDWVQPENDAFKIGHVVEAILQGRDYMKIEGLTQKNGKLYAKFENAIEMANRAKRDPVFMKMMHGELQEIYTGEISGLPWKCKTDCVHHELQVITDLKTTADFGDDWMEVDGKNKKVAWYNVFNYARQMAIQRELVFQQVGKVYEVVIAAVSKQDPPDIALIHFGNEKDFEREMEVIADKSERVKKAYKLGAKPIACGKCDYCRGVKVLTGFEEARGVYE